MFAGIRLNNWKTYTFMKKLYLIASIIGMAGLLSCQPEEKKSEEPTANTLPEWYYTGGRLGTTSLTTSVAFEQPTEAVQNSGMFDSFKRGEQLFEKQFMSNFDGVRKGLGPVYIRTSCMHCHPGYGHGQRVSEYNTTEIGNGYLLVVYNPTTEAYVSWLAGMPQGKAVEPFKAPVDESKVKITWKNYVDEWGNKFPDGTTYELQYPEVTIPEDAFYVVNRGYELPEQYEVRLESTIGIYGTGLLDAIPDDSLKAEYAKQEKDGYMKNGLNPAFFANGEWVSQYSNSLQGDGSLYPRRFTYALSRGPLQDAAGANAIWNITNVTRSDRRYHYMDAAGTYVKYSATDPDVQAGFDAYIAQADPNKEYPEWWEGTMEERITAYLTSKDLPIEMTDDEYVDLMVWHRGLAVPAARNVDDGQVLKGKELFTQIGCAYCHRPSWTTGQDEIRDPAKFFKGNSQLPRYPNQKIWPYTDMVQHKLHMVNDIRTGWCRTTPLWGRGLHQKCTGSATADRLHDCRARNVIEAIMWHGNAQSDARYSIEKFRALSAEERDAIVKFIDAI